MESVNQVGGTTKKGKLAGSIVSCLCILFLLMDGIVKLFKPAPVIEAFAHIDVPIGLAVGLGILLLICTFVYAIPRTAFLGAILLTGYLGGATAIHVRSGTPFYFPVIIGILVWLGLYLRDEKLRSLILN